MMKMVRIFCSMMVLFTLCIQAYGQGDEKAHTPYYLDINTGNSLAVYDLPDEMLNIQYHDRYGRNKDIVLTIINGSGVAVGKYSLSKAFGLNHFQVSLAALFAAWKEGDVYTAYLTDEFGKRYSLLIRKRVPIKNDLTIGILVNPITLTCNDLEGNLVDFYASLQGGKAPYTVNWYIMDDTRASFLYQPREEHIERPGNTLVVRVDKTPDYYVMVLVKDACGQEQKQMVHLVCEEKKKKINTVFVEPIHKLPTTVKGIN